MWLKEAYNHNKMIRCLFPEQPLIWTVSETDTSMCCGHLVWGCVGNRHLNMVCGHQTWAVSETYTLFWDFRAAAETD